MLYGSKSGDLPEKKIRWETSRKAVVKPINLTVRAVNLDQK